MGWTIDTSFPSGTALLLPYLVLFHQQLCCDSFLNNLKSFWHCTYRFSRQPWFHRHGIIMFSGSGTINKCPFNTLGRSRLSQPPVETSNVTYASSPLVLLNAIPIRSTLRYVTINSILRFLSRAFKTQQHLNFATQCLFHQAYIAVTAVIVMCCLPPVQGPYGHFTIRWHVLQM